MQTKFSDKSSQSSLFGDDQYKLDLPDLDIDYQPSFLDTDIAWRWYQALRDRIDWRQETITLFGKRHKVPRLSCWMAEAGLDYSYSNMTMWPTDWSDDMRSIKSYIETHSGLIFNSVLLNYYRDGQDSNGWHADNEPELGSNPVIASLSLGGTRDFQLRNNADKQLKYSIALEHGSLLLMRGETQSYWQHHLPKRATAEPRINLTFRTIKKF